MFFTDFHFFMKPAGLLKMIVVRVLSFEKTCSIWNKVLNDPIIAIFQNWEAILYSYFPIQLALCTNEIHHFMVVVFLAGKPNCFQNAVFVILKLHKKVFHFTKTEPKYRQITRSYYMVIGTLFNILLPTKVTFRSTIAYCQ